MIEKDGVFEIMRPDGVEAGEKLVWEAKDFNLGFWENFELNGGQSFVLPNSHVGVRGGKQFIKLVESAFSDREKIGNSQSLFIGKKGGAVEKIIDLIKIDNFWVKAEDVGFLILVEEGIEGGSTIDNVVAMKDVDHKTKPLPNPPLDKGGKK